MKLQKYCVYGSDQHEKLNKVPLRWEPEIMISPSAVWRGQGRSVDHPWIGLAPTALVYRDTTGRKFSVPRGSEVYHWEVGKIKFVAWKSISGRPGRPSRMTLRELCE